MGHFSMKITPLPGSLLGGNQHELVFKNLLETLFVERMDQNEEIFARFMNDKSFQKVVTGWLSSEAYRKLNTTAEAQNSENRATSQPNRP